MVEELENPEVGQKRPTETQLQQERPKLKRKKTVTWADGEVPFGDEEGEEEGSDLDVNLDDLGNPISEPEPQQQQQPDAQPINSLFIGLDDSALQNQEAVPKTVQESLTRTSLLQRRIQNIDHLMSLYQHELWALADELQLTHAEFQAQRPEVAVLKEENEEFQALKERLQGNEKEAGNIAAAWEAYKKDQEQKQEEQEKQAIKEATKDSTGDKEKPTDVEQNNQVLDTKGGQTQTGAGPSFEDLERLILALPPLDPPAQKTKRSDLITKRQLYLKRINLLGRLEASALAATGREMDARGAVAVLCGANNRYFMSKTAVLLGRVVPSREGQPPPRDSDIVDVDLGEEGSGAAATVSRQQAQIFLDASGVFKLKNVGRRAVMVNGVTLEKGQFADLPNLSLVCVAGIVLMFMVNQGAVERIVARALSV